MISIDIFFKQFFYGLLYTLNGQVACENTYRKCDIMHLRRPPKSRTICKHPNPLSRSKMSFDIGNYWLRDCYSFLLGRAFLLERGIIKNYNIFIHVFSQDFCRARDKFILLFFSVQDTKNKYIYAHTNIHYTVYTCRYESIHCTM